MDGALSRRRHAPGGGEIRADLDKPMVLASLTLVDLTMSSAYVIMDITNPEKQPTVIAEIRMPRHILRITQFNPLKTDNTDDILDLLWYAPRVLEMWPEHL